MKQTSLPPYLFGELPDTSFSLDMTSSELLLSVPQESVAVARPRHRISRAHGTKIIDTRHISYHYITYTSPCRISCRPFWILDATHLQPQ